MDGKTTTLIVLILVANLIVPLIVGNWLGRAFKLKDLSGRISAVTLAILLAISPFVFQLATGQSLLNAIPLGIDLAGGTNLVWQVDEKLAQDLNKTVDSRSMNELIQAIKRRINPSGAEEVTVRQVGQDRVEVIIPGADADEVERKKRLMNDLGSLEFSLLANTRDHNDLIARGRQLTENQTEVRDGTKVRARFVKVAKTPDGTFKMAPDAPSTLSRTRNVEGADVLEYLTVVPDDNKKITGDYLTRAEISTDDGDGPAVSFNFSTKGAYLFESLTSQNRPKKDGFKSQLAILLNDEIHSAPNINAVISNRGQITGEFTIQEVNELIGVLNAGALELPIKKDPINEFTISPTLGIDVQTKGKLAIAISAIVVLIFMVFYYGTAGLIADVCLVVNLILVLGAMALINATLSLPGLAGLVLTIGMSVDANVLIFERIREELAKGSSLRMAINNGFAKAFSTIMDANITTLITAVVLYYIGTDQVKGFAVTLFIGIVMGVFSAVYVGRLIFEILERKRVIKTLKMRSSFGKTNFDFLKLSGLCATISIAMIILGLSVFFYRGQDNLDIDFTGGSMVTFKFEEDMNDIDAARAALQSKMGSNISLERLQVPNEVEGNEEIYFRLRTINENLDTVRDQVDEAFAGSQYKLKKVSLDFKAGEPKPAAEGESTVPVYNLTFTDALTTANVTSLLTGAIETQYEKSNQEIDRVTSLITLTGTQGPGVDAAEGVSKKYTGFELSTDPSISPESLTAALASLQTQMAEKPIFYEINTFDAAVAGETRSAAVFAMFASILAIILYIWFRFEHLSYGVAAAVALFHDVLVVLGLVAICSMISGNPIADLFGFNDFKINLAMIAAFLTLIGYSLNDTIVIFDRIREVKGKSPQLTYDMINSSVNQTLSRTILTSFTTLIVVAILYAIGGEGIHGFAFVLTAGVIVGTYSTIYVANPILLWFETRPKRTPVTATQPVKAKA